MNRRMTRRYALLIVFVSIALLAGSGAFYTRWSTERAQQQSDMRWCALLSSLDVNDPPATTPRAKEIQMQLHQLRLDLGCVKR